MTTATTSDSGDRVAVEPLTDAHTNEESND